MEVSNGLSRQPRAIVTRRIGARSCASAAIRTSAGVVGGVTPAVARGEEGGGVVGWVVGVGGGGPRVGGHQACPPAPGVHICQALSSTTFMFLSACL